MKRRMHTPGPWPRAGKWNDAIRFYSPGWVSLAGQPDAESIANARLIAAAPDLLRIADNALGLLERLSSRYSVQFEANHLADISQGIRETKAAIAKATGETDD